MPRSIPHKKHTNLLNEIETTEDTPNDRSIIIFALTIVTAIAVLIIEWGGIADWLLEILAN